MSRCVTLINSERSKVRTCPQQPWERQKETEHPILTSGQDPKKNRPFVLDHGVVVHHAPCIVAPAVVAVSNRQSKAGQLWPLFTALRVSTQYLAIPAFT